MMSNHKYQQRNARRREIRDDDDYDPDLAHDEGEGEGDYADYRGFFDE